MCEGKGGGVISLREKCLLMYLALSGERSVKKIIDLDIDPLYVAGMIELIARQKEEPLDRLNYRVSPVSEEEVNSWVVCLEHSLQYQGRPTLMASNVCLRCGGVLQKTFRDEMPAKEATWTCSNSECGVVFRLKVGLKILTDEEVQSLGEGVV